MGVYDLRTYRHETRDIFAHVPFNNNGCVAFAIARALADDPGDTAEVAELAALVVDDIATQEASRGKKRGYTGKGLDRRTGSHWGCIAKSAAKVGLEGELIRTRKDPDEQTNGRAYGHWGVTVKTRSDVYPTVAQVIKNNPDIKEALIRATGHAGYYKDGVGYGLGARMRVNYIVVLDRYSDHGEPPVQRDKQANNEAMEKARRRREAKKRLRERGYYGFDLAL